MAVPHTRSTWPSDDMIITYRLTVDTAYIRAGLRRCERQNPHRTRRRVLPWHGPVGDAWNRPALDSPGGVTAVVLAASRRAQEDAAAIPQLPVETAVSYRVPRNTQRPTTARSSRGSPGEAMSPDLTPTVRAGRLLRMLGWITLGIGVLIVFALPSDDPLRADLHASSARLLLVFGAYGGTCLVVGGALKREAPWARLAGAGVAIVSLPYFPFGTLLGVAVLIYILRGWRDAAEI